MKNIFVCKLSAIAIIVLFSVSGCVKSSPLEKMFGDAIKVKVLIYAGSTIPQAHYETNDIDKMKGFVNYIDEKTDATGTCAYEGRIVLYYTETDTSLMKFSLAKGCCQISYTADGKPYTKALTQTGINYFQSLKRTE